MLYRFLSCIVFSLNDDDDDDFVVVVVVVVVAGSFPASSLLSSQRTVHTIDFSAVSTSELQDFQIPFSFRIDKTGNSMSFICFLFQCTEIQCLFIVSIFYYVFCLLTRHTLYYIYSIDAWSRRLV